MLIYLIALYFVALEFILKNTIGLFFKPKEKVTEDPLYGRIRF